MDSKMVAALLTSKDAQTAVSVLKRGNADLMVAPVFQRKQDALRVTFAISKDVVGSMAPFVL